ncbi:MAG: biotin--[acetyl-CoA-carboxylase] ligase [Bacteroidota bacterium]
MKIVKLDAINSTNSFLKEMVKEESTDNWTIVSTDFQTSGRGQLHTKWFSFKAKNLLFSVLIRFDNFEVSKQFYLNCAVSLGIYKALEKYNIPNLSVKWPNDIMADKKKLGGILIENTIQNSKIKYAVVGVGININQDYFPEYLSKAISIKEILKKDLDRDQILMEIINSIQKYIEQLENEEYDVLKNEYEQVLFKNGLPQMFEDQLHNRFQGIITGVSEEGKLRVEMEDESIKEFGFKEIKFL